MYWVVCPLMRFNRMTSLLRRKMPLLLSVVHFRQQTMFFDGKYTWSFGYSARHVCYYMFNRNRIKFGLKLGYSRGGAWIPNHENIWNVCVEISSFSMYVYMNLRKYSIWPYILNSTYLLLIWNCSANIKNRWKKNLCLQHGILAELSISSKNSCHVITE